MSYATQIADIAAEMNRTTYTTSDFERFLRLGQRFLENKYHPMFLKQTTSINAPTGGDSWTLPYANKNYFELLQFKIVITSTGSELIYKPSTEKLVRSFRSIGLTPPLYWVDDPTLYTSALYTVDVSGVFTYITDDAFLSSTNTTNLWDTYAPDLLFYAACMAAARYDKDADRLKIYVDFTTSELPNLEKRDIRSKSSYTTADSYIYGRG